MIGFALALTLALQQDAPFVDVAVYRDAALRVALPRPFDDWVFSPATERGTTTVILHPRGGSLGDELWGALVITPWDGELRIGEVADRRIRTTWRPALGSTFRLLERDSVAVAGFPAIRALMSGSIARAVIEVEEFLVARGADLVVLQFRYPRGVPRDSIAAGYARSLSGLRLGGPIAPAPLTRASGGGLPPASWSASIQRGQAVFETPEQLRAAAPGWLTAELAAGGRRVMRFSPAIGGADTTLYAVGRFRTETRRLGRLTIRLWREVSADTVFRATDTLIATAARAWARYWKAFGPVPTTELSLVETAWARTRGGPAILFLGADASEESVLWRELSRTWWGGAVAAAGSADSLVGVVLPDWAAAAFGAEASTLPASPIELARRTAGEARFREALRTFVAASRAGAPAVSELLRVLGDSASVPIRPLLR